MTRKKSPLLRLLALLAILSLVAAACSDDDDPSVDAGDNGDTEQPDDGGQATDRGNVNGTLEIGSILPSSGSLGVLGEPMNKAVEMAIRDINAAGGVLGNDVVLRAEDSETRAEAAQAAAEQLLNSDRVDVIVGAAASSVSLAIIDRVTGAGAVQCSPSNTGVDFTVYEDDGFYFRTSPPDNLQAQVLADLIAADGFTEVAIVNQADAYGQGFADALRDELESRDITVVAEETYQLKDTDFSAQVGTIKDANPQAVAAIGFPDEGKDLLAEMVRQGVGPDAVQIYVTDGLQSSQLGGLTNPDNPAIVSGIKGTAPAAAPPGGAPFFPEAFAEFAPGVDTIFSAHAYDCVIVIALAAIQAESDDPADIAQEMVAVTKDGEKCSTFEECVTLLEAGEDIDYDGAAGPLDFVDAGEPGRGEYETWTFTDEVTTGDDGAPRNGIETLDQFAV